MSKNEKELSRRLFLSGAGGVISMAMIRNEMLNQIVGSFISNANAAPGVMQNFKYINLFTAGGASRWYFDLPIAPNGTDTMVANQMVITKHMMGNDGKATGAYAHAKIGEFYLPALWSFKIPTANGSTVSLAEVANHTLMIRGVDQGLDGHEFNTLRQNSPIPGGLTYSGLFADTGESPIPAANGGGMQLEHRSGNNKAILPFIYRSDYKVLSNSFASFKTNNPKSFNKKDSAEKAINLAVKSIQNTQGSNSPYMSAVKANRDNALELLMSDFATIDNDYIKIYNKYQMLVDKALAQILPGITDAPIIAENRNTKFNIFVPELNPGVSASEKTGNICTSLHKIKASLQFAHAFAMAEFLITRNLSSSFCAGLGFFNNFDIQNYYSFNSSTGKIDTFEPVEKFRSLGVDMHNTGTHPALIIMTKHYFTYLTCLHELVTQLKKQNMFDQTLIHNTSDFNRIPRTNGSGADHGFNGSNTSLISGRIKKLTVVGNIKQNSDGRGTWGSCGANDFLGKREINLGNVASTICAMFELPTPAPNDQSLVNIKDGIVTAPKEKPKNVA